MKAGEASAFVRDRTTYVAYAILGVFGYAIYALGPTIAHMRDEEHLSHTVASLYGTLFFTGLLAGGTVTPRLLRRFGVTPVLWSSVAFVVVGIAGLAVAHDPTVSIGFATYLGVASAPFPVAVAATLRERHAEHVHVALTEANVAASIAACVVPAVLGIAAVFGLSWRVVFIVPIVVCAGAFAFRGSGHVSPLPGEEDVVSDRPSGSFVLWILILSAGSLCESGLIFWGATLLDDRAGVSLDAATTLLVVFFAGELGSRIWTGRMVPRMGPPRVLAVLFVTSAVGLALVWLAASPLLAVVALAISGLGVGGIFPLSYSVAMTAAPAAAASSAAKITGANAGVSIVVPLVFGVIGDEIGLRSAFLAGPLAALLGLSLLASTRGVPPSDRSLGDGGTSLPLNTTTPSAA